MVSRHAAKQRARSGAAGASSPGFRKRSGLEAHCSFASLRDKAQEGGSCSCLDLLSGIMRARSSGRIAMRTLEYTPISEDEYLRLEAQSPIKHEYVNGEMFAMTGGTLRHNTIALNIAARAEEPSSRHPLQGVHQRCPRASRQDAIPTTTPTCWLVVRAVRRPWI